MVLRRLSTYADSDLPYHEEKLFNLNIYDDGPTESYGSHRATSGTGVVNDVPYLKAMFERGLAQNEILTDGKLILLLERYMGESIQLPAHEGVDDSVYGSLAIYRQEIVEELACWAANNSIEELDVAVKSAVAEHDSDKYLEVWDEIYDDIASSLR